MPEQIQNYAAAIDFLYGRINYERVDSLAYSTSDFKLDRMRMLLALIGNPHDRIPVVHVAGTKGKGSTCSMIASILAASSLRTGLYISPHISAFEERMTVNGIRPSKNELVGLVNRLLPVVAEMDSRPGQMQPTYFELATAIAWLFFEDRQCDIAVLETGLGGRLDSTNICRPLACVITNISRDHTQILGSTLRQIAREKGGIVKQQVPVICGVSQPEAAAEIERICRDRASPLYWLGSDITVTNRRAANSDSTEPRLCGTVDVSTQKSEFIQVPVALRGAHQTLNTALALAAIDELRNRGHAVSEQNIRAGLASVEWPARVEVVSQSPTVVIDAAHNWESARALVATLRDEFAPRRRILIFAATRDKDVTGLLRLLVPEFDTIILTRYRDNPRGVPVQEMKAFIESISNRLTHAADSPEAAWNLARGWAQSDDLIAITGSFFLVAELRDLVLSSSAPRS